MTPIELKAKYQKLHRLAMKAAEAQDKFREEFDKSKESPWWGAMCEQEHLAPDANFNDWMC